MSRPAPRVRVINHFSTRDGIDIIARSAGGSFFIGRNANGKYVVGGSRDRSGPGTWHEFDDKAKAQAQFHWLISEYEG